MEIHNPFWIVFSSRCTFHSFLNGLAQDCPRLYVRGFPEFTLFSVMLIMAFWTQHFSIILRVPFHATSLASMGLVVGYHKLLCDSTVNPANLPFDQSLYAL